MPYSGPHSLLTLNGNLFGTTEQWSFGLRFSGSPPLTQAMVDSAAAFAKTWFTTAGTGFYASQSITHVKLAPIGPDGKYPAGLDSVEANITGGAGTYSSASPFPPQVALTMSLTTAVSRGIASVGRAYLPAPGYAVGPTGGLSPANVGVLLPHFRTMVLALNGIGFGSATVMSKKWGQQRTITGLRCGLVYDTMRSRRRSIPETPVSLAL